MVGCDICGNWFHITCINTTEEFVNVVNFYHCEKCVRSKYLNFAQYCYHFGSDLLENGDIIAIGEKWRTKSPALQTAIGSHQYLTPNEYDAALHKHSRILSKRGLANPYNNCWLNVILHVVCGTFYYDLVNTMTEAKDNISQCLVEIHNHLTRLQANKGGRPSLPDSAVQLASAVNCDLKAREQKDVCDFYDELVLHLLKKSQNQQAEHLLQARFLNLKTCQCCYTHEGHTAILNYLTVKVLQTSQIVRSESLIWEKCTGQYSTAKESRDCPNCTAKNERSPGYHEITLFQKCPVVLPVLLNRTSTNMRTTVGSPVKVPYMLDISNLSIQFDKKETCHYILFAVIHLKARTVRRGHYTVTLFYSSSAYTFDDGANIQRGTISDTLNDEKLMETAYMVFYINKLAIQARPIPLRFSSALTVEETKAVEDLWFADRNPDCSALETHDVQTCWGTQNLNDKIICTYLKSISTKDSGVKVCILSSIVYSQIEEGNSSWEYQNAIQDHVLSNDLLIIPIHHPGPIGHWTLAGIFSSKKLIMHLDSMHSKNERVLVRFYAL